MPEKAKRGSARRPSRVVTRGPGATRPKRAAGKGRRSTATTGRDRPAAGKPALLAGGNPQIAKARRRRPRAGLHRGHAGLEARRRAPPRRAHRAHRAPRAQGREVELALLWHRRPGLLPHLPLLREVRQGGLLPRHVAASHSPPASRRARTRATSTSTRTTRSTRRSWRTGSGGRHSCPAGPRSAPLSAGRLFHDRRAFQPRCCARGRYGSCCSALRARGACGPSGASVRTRSKSARHSAVRPSLRYASARWK